jgi:hypothetical protein
LLPDFSNDGYSTLPLPFSFTFGDQAYDSITVSANGYLTFSGSGNIKDNFIIPGIAQPNQFIAPFWDDLNPVAGGSLYQITLGTPPNREYVVEWYLIPRAGFDSTSSQLTFEVVLFEGSNQILLQYQTLLGTAADGSSATIGVEFADGNAGTEYSYNQAASIQEAQALLFVPTPTGSSPLSNSCSIFTRPVDRNGGFFDSYPFCIEFPEGAVKEAGTIRIQNLTSAPPVPSDWFSLEHYADINLSITPPFPLSPLPEAYVCYHYSSSDVLQAGGHPENLYLAAFNDASGIWEILPTAANTTLHLLTARAPHLSIYGVVTTQAPSRLPVTGLAFPASRPILLVALGLLIILLARLHWMLRRA